MTNPNLKIKRTITSDIELSATEIGILFASMDGQQQAEFFNAVADDVNKWDNPFCFQLQAIVETEQLSSHAKKIMKDIGEYANALSVRQDKALDYSSFNPINS